jgi:N-acetylmuramoyl-L-alanine amidase
MIFARCRVVVSLQFFIILLMSFVSTETIYSRQWETAKAAQAYQLAQQKKDSLDPASPSAQTQLLECARAYRKVYLADPHYRFSGQAIYEEGLLYQQLGDKLGNIDSYKTATNRFSLLVNDYEGNPHCPDALLRMASIYSNFLNDEPSAQKSCQRLQTRYKHSPATIQCLQMEAAIPTPSPEKDPVPTQKNVYKPNISENGSTALVQNVSYKIADDSVQAIIELDAWAHYKSARLKNPDRLYFDISKTRLRPNLARTIPINNSDLNKIRISQNDSATVRIVFDISKTSDYTVSELRDPFNIVITFIRQKQAVSVNPTVNTINQISPSTSSETQAVTSKAILVAPKDVKKILIAPPQPITIPSVTTEEPPSTTPKALPLTSRGDLTLTRMLGLKISRIVLDPGHGGHDLGTIGTKGLYEKDLVLSLAQELQSLLQDELGAEVILTRNDDTYIPLEERTSIANQHHADLFVSIHANSSKIHSISGIESYYLDFAKTNVEREIAARENATSSKTIGDLEDLIKKIAQADKSAESRELATIVQRKLYSSASKIIPATQNRGVRSAPFVVLIGANMPSILTEVAFISNPRDERLLNKSINRKELAKALYSGIVAYMETLGVNIVHNQTLLLK